MKYDYILEYNNIISTYIAVYHLDEEGNIDANVMDLNEIQEGLPVAGKTIAETIKDTFDTEGKSCLLLLNVDEAFTTLRTYPNIPLKKSKKIYDVQIAEQFEKLNEYRQYPYDFETRDGSAYFNYMFPSKMLDYFKEFLKIAGFSSYDYCLKANYLARKFAKASKLTSFNLFYIENEIINYCLYFNNHVIFTKTIRDYQYDINAIVLSCIDGFNVRFPRNKIDKLISNQEKQIFTDFNCLYINEGLTFEFDGEKF